VNLPFVLGLLFIILLSGGEDTFSTIWPYLVLLPIFTIQLILPTWAGWVTTLVGWSVCALGAFAYARFVGGAEEFTWGFLLLWGVAPLFAILAVPPRPLKDWTRSR
jgi:hypothetical protein